ncbi:MAG: hypothetical protein LBM70_07420 [Victivallales bacterium]|jgi:hypothetical protein|nr:hypothetical protein [Victivallales bacterium]
MNLKWIRHKGNHNNGQVLLEYVIMLLLLTVLSLSLLTLAGAFSKQGSRMIELISADFP